MQFSKKNIEDQWEWDLINEFPEFFLEPSEEVLIYYKEGLQKDRGDIPKSVDDLINLRLDFEFHSSWRSIMRDHLLAIRELIEKAKSNGHKISYKGFIMKEKFGTLRDQGIFSGKDQDIYKTEYYDLVDSLYRTSS